MSRRPSSRSKSLQQLEEFRRRGMGSIQIEMRRKRNPNPNPKDVGVLPRRHVGSVILDLHDRLREGHRATAACRVTGVSAPVATKGHRHETARRRCTHPRVSIAHQRAASWVAPPLTGNNVVLCTRILA
jgi:hypothetical protein